MLWVALQFRSLPPAALEPIAAWACQFTPKVVVEPPQALALEVEASLRYFEGLPKLKKTLCAGLAEMGFEALLATAPTCRAALWRARGGGARLEDLPAGVTGGDAEFFRQIGVATVGGLLALPREGLARRCGPVLIDALDRACGRLPEAHEFFAPPPRFSAALELPAEVAEAGALMFAARRLLVQLAGLLAARQAGVRAFRLRLQHRRGAASEVEVRLASPARDAERLSQLLRERLAALELAQPVEAIALEAEDFTPLAPPSGSLFGDAAAEAEDWARLVERLQARLGRDAVHGISCVPDHRPEHAWRRVEPGDWDPREFTPPGPRPSWLLHQALPVEEAKLQLLAGPERIECGWWDGDEARRDYFVARLGESLAWVYREDGEWRLHGWFA